MRYEIGHKQNVILEEIKRIEHILFCIENGYSFISFNGKKIDNGRPVLLSVIPSDIYVEGELMESILSFYRGKHSDLTRWLKEL